MGNPCDGIRRIVAVLLMVGITGCSRPDPNGQFAGVMKDWVHEVFTGIMVTGGWECEVEDEHHCGCGEETGLVRGGAGAEAVECVLRKV